MIFYVELLRNFLTPKAPTLAEDWEFGGEAVDGYFFDSDTSSREETKETILGEGELLIFILNIRQRPWGILIPTFILCIHNDRVNIWPIHTLTFTLNTKNFERINVIYYSK